MATPSGTPRALGIILNDRCALRCKHCSLRYNANYRGTSWKIDEAELRNVILQADANVYKVVMMAGGEPSLVPELVRAGIQVCHEKQILSAIVTAPVWARTAKLAAGFFARVPGLDIVMLSYDVFHLEFISVEHYVNAVKEARSAGMTVFLNVCYSNSEEKTALMAPIDSISTMIERIHYQPVLPFGNAATNSATIGLELRQINGPADLAALNRSCVAGTALLNRDGNLYACCWAAKVENSPLKYFHVPQLGFRLSSLVMEQDLAFQAMRRAGFVDSLTPEATAKLVALVQGESFVNECDLCVRVMREADGAWMSLVQPSESMAASKV